MAARPLTISTFPSTDTTYTANYTPVSVTYLSDLPTTGKATNGWGSMERDLSNGEKKAKDGHLIQLDGVTYSKGIGRKCGSSATFNLAGNYTTFVSDIGVDDEVGSNGSVKFQVWGDGVLLFDGPTDDRRISHANDRRECSRREAIETGGDRRRRWHSRTITPIGPMLVCSRHPAVDRKYRPPPPPPPAAVSFASPVSYLTGANAHGITSADLNGDGKPDLAVANSATSTVSVLLGRGDGTFVSPVNYGVGKTPKSVAAADLNGDGRIDLVTADQDSATVSVLMNLGNGSLCTRC